VITASIKAVVFDAVGTLLVPNPPPAHVYASTAARHGLTLSRDGIADRFTEAFQKEDHLDRIAGWVTDETRERDRWRRIVAATLPGLPDAGFDDLFDHFARPEAWEVPIDAARAVKFLTARDGVQLGVASNFDRRLLEVVDGKDELAPVREHVVISSLVGVRKPHGDFFLAVAERMMCAVNEVLFVGDDFAYDFLAAQAAGMPAVLFDPLFYRTKVTPRIETLTELLTPAPPPGLP
jgi:putative hydrolase of the HAD superfamily